MADPVDTAVAALLSGLVSGDTTLALGTNLFTGPTRPHGRGVPVGPVVFVLAGAEVREPYLGTDTDFCRENVQVTVRGKPDTHAVTLTLARAVLTTVHKAQPSGFVDVLLANGINDLGTDGNGCPVFTLNFQARVTRAT